MVQATWGPSRDPGLVATPLPIPPSIMIVVEKDGQRAEHTITERYPGEFADGGFVEFPDDPVPDFAERCVWIPGELVLNRE